ncbi:Pr6Pr family membrane protein [Streptomyces sp. NPDC048436]|uniref:Pr6Pr family membrane protein n=1 Tax=Streptomyces sp. NPDC048436 TaxID=3365550 RepID=UPI00371A1E50
MIAPTPWYAPAEAVVPPVRRPLAGTFRALVALAAAIGVMINLGLGSPLRVLSYFTIQSNVLVAVVFALSARRAWQGRRPLPPLVTGGTLLFISITGLVYHFVLADDASGFSMTGETAPLTGWRSLANDLLHTVTPIGAVLNWLLLTTPRRLYLRQALLWMLYPLAYLAFALTRGALMPPGSAARYTYPFLDVDAHGYPVVLANAIFFGLAFYALAALVVGLDRIRPEPPPRGPKTGFRLRALVR